MPRTNAILNLPGCTIGNIHPGNPVTIEVKCSLVVRCKHCNSKQLRRKAKLKRTVRHESFGFKQSLLIFHGYKFYCNNCKRYFNQSFPSVKPYQRATERLKEEIFKQHIQGISQKDLAQTFKVGTSTIERWFHQCYFRENQHIKERDCPQVLGIDEHFFSKKHGFATTFCDLRKHRIFDVVLGRAQQDLASYLATLPGKDKVKVVCIDLSSTYRSLVKLHFPNAHIVADRFHVIRLINQMALQTYQSIDPGIKWNRGTLAMLRTNPENLSEKQIVKLDEYLKNQPLIKQIYDFKQRLHRLLMIKHRTAKQCKRLIPFFLDKIDQLKQTALKPLETLGKTLYQWRNEIACMWRFTKNNGITEGFHRKMKLIQRRAYGFRNFENYRMRVRVLCG